MALENSNSNLISDKIVSTREGFDYSFLETPQDHTGFEKLGDWNNRHKANLSLADLKGLWEFLKKMRDAQKATEEISTNPSIFGESVVLSELLKTEFPEARFAVDQLFEAGTINMLSAPPNKWKSWIVVLCAICVASGKDLFGKFKAEKQAVMIVNEEDTNRLIQERCNMLMEEIEDLPIYFHIGKQIKLNDAFVDQLIEEAKKKKVGVIIFDSLRSVHDADENSSKEMQAIMDQLKKITHEGITVLFTHHNRKKSKFGGKEESGEESRGSSAINAAIHGHLSCDETERDGIKYLIIAQPKLKADEKLKPFEVHIENDKEHKKMRFIYEGEYKNQERLFSQAKEALLKIFEGTDEGLSIKYLIGMKIGAGTTVRTTIKILEGQGLIFSKTRKEAEFSRLTINGPEGKHNEKFYFSAKKEIGDLPADELDGL